MGPGAGSVEAAESDPRAQLVETGLRSPPLVPDYELVHLLGRGSYGDVWLAGNVLGQLRAVKVIYRSRFLDPRPFEREFEGIQRFEPLSRSHPSQLAILHVGKNEAAGYFYYVMELADAVEQRRRDGGLVGWSDGQKKSGRALPPCHATGNSLFQSSDTPPLHRPDPYTPHTLRHDLEQHGRLPIPDCVQIGLSLTTALGHLHSHSLVHRDIKPSNVIFVNGVPKLGDIGLVTEAGDTQSVVGTEGYIPPEGPGTVQADIFSLGKVLYEMSTGMDRRRFAELPADLREWSDRAQVGEFNEILLKACAKDPTQRYHTAEEMRRDLKFLQNGRSLRRAHRVAQWGRLLWRAAMWLVPAGAALSVILALGPVRHPIGTTHKEKRSSNATANRFYDLGDAYLDKMRGTNFGLAVDCFERAIQADPKFAQAYARLATTYCWNDGEWNPAWKYYPRAKEMALKALALDGTLAEPHTVLGNYYADVDWAWGEAEREHKHAIDLESSGATHLGYAELLRKAGHLDEALQEVVEAKDRDPLSLSIRLRWIDFLIQARKYSDALTEADQLARLNPSLNVSWARYKAFCGLRQFSEAIEAERSYLAAGGDSQAKIEMQIARLQCGLAGDGTNGYWSARLENAREDKDIYEQACCYAQLGRTNEAVACLQNLLQKRDRWLAFWVMSDWRLEPLRSEPRFHAILRAMHFEGPGSLGARSKRS